MRLALTCVTALVLLAVNHIRPTAAFVACPNPITGSIDVSVPRAATTQGFTAKFNRLQNDVSGSGSGPYYWDISPAGDADLDGYADFMLSHMGQDLGPAADAGSVWLFYGSPGLRGVYPLVNSPASSDQAHFYGIAASAVLGRGITSGKFNLDSCQDLFFGAPGHNVESGIVYQVNGQFQLGRCRRFIDLNLASASSSLPGTLNGNFGTSVAAADLNGDRFDDFVVGAEDEDYSHSAPSSSDANGGVFVYYGPAVGAVPSYWADAPVKFLGESHHSYTGESVSTGDFNGDRCADILVGAGSAVTPSGETRGAAYILYQARSLLCSGFRRGGVSTTWNLANTGIGFGPPGIRLLGEADGDRAGSYVSFVGDVNGDGFEDVAIDAHASDYSATATLTGAVYLIYGGARASDNRVELSTIDRSWGAKFYSTTAEEKVGMSVGAAGDVDGDGYDDFLIGTQQNYEVKAYLVFGRPGQWSGKIELTPGTGITQLTGDYYHPSENQANTKGRGVGDVDGDGLDDFVLTGSHTVDARGYSTAFLIRGSCRVP